MKWCTLLKMERVINGQDIINKLKLEGKVEILNKPEHLEAMQKLDGQMQEVHRDYLEKEANSERDFYKIRFYNNFN